MLAHLVLELESKMIDEEGSEMKMVYLNAVPRDQYGYNDMAYAEERVRVFNGLLEKAEDRFKPKKIFVACGSLSALLDEVPYVEKHRQKVQGIGWIGRQLLMESIQEKPDAPVFVLRLRSPSVKGFIARQALPEFKGLRYTLSSNAQGWPIRSPRSWKKGLFLRRSWNAVKKPWSLLKAI